LRGISRSLILFSFSYIVAVVVGVVFVGMVVVVVRSSSIVLVMLSESIARTQRVAVFLLPSVRASQWCTKHD